MAPATTVLGKRKRVKQQKEQKNPADKATKTKVEDDDAAAAERAALEEAQAIFRRHFEAQFVPLQEETGAADAGKSGKKARGPEESDDDSQGGVEDLRSDSEEEDDDDDEEDSEDDDDEDDEDGDDAWGGLSGEDDEDDEDDNKVQVVDHSKPLTTSSTLTRQALMGMTKKEMRAYLSSKPPDALSAAEEEAKAAKKALAAAAAKKKSGERDEADPQNEDSRALLANDLELQRLISESHILSASNPFNTTTSGAARLPFAEGRTRALTADMRVRALGSRGSIFTQQKMPMGMRKGIAGARAAREERRRREAKENGIILERPAEDAAGAGGKGKKGSKKKKTTFGRRDLPVDMPGMGRMKGGELRLSKRDVRAVENEGRRMDSGGKRKRKRR